MNMVDYVAYKNIDLIYIGITGRNEIKLSRTLS